ncbi:hypothetical protein E3E35_00970 [Thermococcus sp. GR7]|uniref:hypothetical protein n=1 Tax=unclassified Thermococcus TaxID=2627626 RepID=UPI0014312297|nr:MULTISPECIES: hypothetical protein [unclassified Thermococcus]NJE42974.1 hypothetical protein [Thermococcus sp. GR6]NJE46000.1 hypothetical protein [Thermococcus sp. GR7]NJE78493.1 hypothetical protein [Thermococcus sp. GR4]NJF22196.1 hypothetical protein [Thermococcus sp. GR5]
MGTLREALEYPFLRAGLIMLLLALIISAMGLYGVDKSYSSNGTLGKGRHFLGDEDFEKSYVYYNRTLIISSSNATFSVIQGNATEKYTQLNGTVKIIPTTRPVIDVFNGTVNYTYTVSAKDYPYAIYSLIAFVLMLVGTVMAFIGYTHFLRDVKEGKR